MTTQTQRPLLVAQADVRAVFKPFALLVHDLHYAQAYAYMHMPHAPTVTMQCVSHTQGVVRVMVRYARVRDMGRLGLLWT